MAKRKPLYSVYQRWCDAGKPYWTGVSLFNEVTGFPTLKRNLNAKDSPNNRMKLDGMLAQYFSTVPAAPLKEEELQSVHTTEKAAATKPHTGAPASVVKLRGGASVVIDNAISKMGPEIPAPYSTSKFALPTFSELPDVLKKARLENTERRRQASMLHDQLAEGIDDPDLRSDVCAEIVQRMDMVMASYDAEREWKLHKVTPLKDEDIRVQYERLDLFELKTVLVDRLSPRVSYWKKQCRLRDGDALVEAKLRLAEAEHEKMIAEDLLVQRRKEREKLAHDAREKVIAKGRSK